MVNKDVDYFYFDIETRSVLDLKKVGRVNYFDHPKTEITLISWAMNNGPIQQWAIGEATPQSLISILERKKPYYKVAHNIIFDQTGLQMWTDRLGLLLPLHWWDYAYHVDTMALGQFYRIGAGLDRISTVLGIETKAIHGKALMRKQGKPDRKGNFPVLLDEEEMGHFREYGKHDVDICRRIHQKFDPLPSHEHKIWQWTHGNNVRGVKVDMRLLKLMQRILQDESNKLLPEFNSIVEHKYSINSPKLKDFFKPYYPACDNMRASTVNLMLKNSKGVPLKIYRALEIKKLLGGSSTKKVIKALQLANQGRICDILTYHRAITKRWSGRDGSGGSGVQAQNFPRSIYTKFDLDPDNEKFLEQAEMLYSMGFLNTKWVKNNLRRIWIASGDMVIHCADYSRIEPVVIFWFAGYGSIPDNWYEQMASVVYGMKTEDVKKDSVERHIGKFASLSCGYGISAGGFVTKAFEAGVDVTHELALRCVTGYRLKHPAVVNLWNHFMQSFQTSLISGGVINACKGLVRFRRLPSITEGLYDMEIRLPSGGLIFYRKAKMDGKDVTYLTSDGGRVSLWYGALMEHICSGTARELMASALLRLREKGYRVINTVHDELWIEARDEAKVTFDIRETMECKPAWGKGLEKLKVDIEVGRRYLK